MSNGHKKKWKLSYLSGKEDCNVVVQKFSCDTFHLCEWQRLEIILETKNGKTGVQLTVYYKDYWLSPKTQEM